MKQPSLWKTITDISPNPFRPFTDIPIVTFSHLRWEYVVQRPQHIMMRLAKHHPVLFVEEPVEKPNKTAARQTILKPAPGITVLTPHVTGPAYEDTVVSYIDRWKKDKLPYEPVLWFYSANFVPFSGIVEHSLIVYDCMDELSAFRGADRNLLYREHMLMTKADVVFTGGVSLYEAKRPLHDQVYCFPSSVDRKHFAKALDSNTRIPGDLLHIPQPVVGYIGVIDERIDLQLLKSLALSLPDISFTMIGPVAKIDPVTLPVLPNIYYLGQKHYETLPGYIKGLDIAIMPFALNEATRFISPTKTPEFLSAMKPVISTPVTDVVRTYSDVVGIGQGVVEWMAYIRRFLGETDRERKTRYKKQYQLVSRTSWDSTVSNMWQIMSDALSKKMQTERRQAIGQAPVPSSLDYTV